jgi:DNA-binding IscR family transcriptional regulator
VTTLVYVVIRTSPNPLTQVEISQTTHISASCLETLLSGLRKADILRGGKGPKAALYLGAKGAELSIADIVRAVDTENLNPIGNETSASHNGTSELSKSMSDQFIARLEEITIQSWVRHHQQSTQVAQRRKTR